MEDVEKLESLCTGSGTVKNVAVTIKNTRVIPQKIKNRVTT